MGVPSLHGHALPRGPLQLLWPAPGVSMCLRVRHATVITRPYDADRGVITIPAGLEPHLTLRAVSVVLAELRIPQDTPTPTCWCGEPLALTGLIPAQRMGEVISSGA